MRPVPPSSWPTTLPPKVRSKGTIESCSSGRREASMRTWVTVAGMQRKREVKMANTTVARPRTARQVHWRRLNWSRFSGLTLCRPSRMATPAVRYRLM